MEVEVLEGDLDLGLGDQGFEVALFGAGGDDRRRFAQFRAGDLFFVVGDRCRVRPAAG